MAANKSTEPREDYECPMLILAVWAQIMPATAAIAELKARACLTEDGGKLLADIGQIGNSEAGKKYQLNLEKIMTDVCGWDVLRAKMALAKAKALGYLEGGPAAN